MKIRNAEPDCGDIFDVDVSSEEVRIMHQALNEVCNGFAVGDFIKIIGDEIAARRELEALKEVYQQHDGLKIGGVRLRLTRDQLRMYCHALFEVGQEIEDWEFETRMGAAREDVQNLIRIIRSVLDC